jgi:hypothetical protein
MAVGSGRTQIRQRHDLADICGSPRLADHEARVDLLVRHLDELVPRSCEATRGCRSSNRDRRTAPRSRRRPPPLGSRRSATSAGRGTACRARSHRPRSASLSLPPPVHVPLGALEDHRERRVIHLAPLPRRRLAALDARPQGRTTEVERDSRTVPRAGAPPRSLRADSTPRQLGGARLRVDAANEASTPTAVEAFREVLGGVNTNAAASVTQA